MELFGQRAGPAMAALVSQGSDAVRQLTTELENSAGTATEVAAVQMRGFNGAMHELTSAFEGLQLAIADSGLLEFATDLINRLAAWVQELSKTSPEILKWGTIVAGLAAVIGPVVLALGMLATGIAAISLPIAGVIAGIAALAAAWVFWDDIKAAFPQTAAVIETTLSVIGTVIKGLMEQLGNFGQWVGQFFSGDFAGAAQTAKDIFAGLGEMAKNVFEIVFPGAIDAGILKIHAVKDAIIELSNAGIEAMQRMVTAITDWVGKKLNAVWDSVGSKVDWVSNKFDGLYDAVVGHSYIPDMVEGIGHWMGQLGDKMVKPAEDAAGSVDSAFSDVGQSIGQTISSSFKGLIDGSKKVKDVLKDLLGQLGQMLMSKAFQSIFGGGTVGLSIGGAGKLPGFKDGGSFTIGGSGGTDSQLVAFRATPGEKVDVRKGNQNGRGGGGPVVPLNINIIGASGDEQMRQMVEQGVAAGLDGYSKEMVRAGFGAQQARYVRRRG